MVATKIEGRLYYMAFLGDDGKLTRFGDVARVADWLVSHPQKRAPEPVAIGPAGPPGSSGPTRPHIPLPVGVAAPETLPEVATPEPAEPAEPTTIGPAGAASGTPTTVGPAGPSPPVPAQAAAPPQSVSSGAPARSAVQ